MHLIMPTIMVLMLLHHMHMEDQLSPLTTLSVTCTHTELLIPMVSTSPTSLTTRVKVLIICATNLMKKKRKLLTPIMRMLTTRNLLLSATKPVYTTLFSISQSSSRL